MTALPIRDNRIRAYVQFIVALLYFLVARALAHRGALALASEVCQPLVEQGILLFLLLLGYSGLGFSLNAQAQPVAEQGFPLRAGFAGEIGLGLTFGWSLTLVGVLAMALIGGIAVRFLAVPSAGLAPWGWLLADVAYFLLLTLAEEIAFRGYGFQRLRRSLGTTVAVFGYSFLAAVFTAFFLPGAGAAPLMVAFFLNLLLTLAYLRTRALWVSWGLNFAWKASRALLFGLAVSGNTTHSPVIEGDPMGSFWLTGGGFGLDGSWFAFLLLLVALPVLYRLTRELDYRYNTPEIIPGGIPVDIDAAARQQHEAAMGSAAPAAPALVQIAPAPMPVLEQFPAPSSSSDPENGEV